MHFLAARLRQELFERVLAPMPGALVICRAWIIFIFSISPCFGQAWSGILTPSRAIDWSHAGLPAKLPNGETTANPWTPPVRTQCGSTINPSGDSTTDTSAVNNAIGSCQTGTYILLGPGNFIFNAPIQLYTTNGITIRGSGAQATTVSFINGGFFQYGTVNYGTATCNWTGGLSQGATTITLSSCSGNPTSGYVLQLTQCNTGLGGPGCTAGTGADNNSVFVCTGIDNVCQRPGQGGSDTSPAQKQFVLVTNNPTGCATSCSVNISPSIYMSNWSNSNSPTAYWGKGLKGVTDYGLGVEDMTIFNNGTGPTANASVDMQYCYASWIKGVRMIGTGYASNPPIRITGNNKNLLIMSNYIFSDYPLDSAYPPAIQEAGDSDTLIMNNIATSGEPWEGQGAKAGTVYAYNYSRDTFAAYVLDIFEHNAGNAFTLYEGNESPTINEDNTHGTHNLSTAFRNYLRGWSAPFSPVNQAGITWGSWDRFTNSIGNVIGTPGLAYTGYQNVSNTGAAGGYIFSLGYGGGFGDPLTATTAMRWGNWDSVTNAVRWCGNSSNSGWSTICGGTSEVPSNLASPNSSYSNPVPSTSTLPASFFLPIAAHPNGGTGLNWWKICTAWTTFPTTCAATQVQPFPAAGPDVSGGPYNAGYAYDIPAQVAWLNLPVDPAYQSSYTITGSSWAGGTETLTVSNLPNGTHLLGPFQLSGMPAACTKGATINASGEILMTNSSSTTISFALASNPGTSCTGTFKFPDIRQFDERVYQTDPSISSSLNPPMNLTATVN
jgi:hypothetical protein